MKRRPRLKGFDYKGYYRYFVTICTHDRIPLFRNGTVVKGLIKSLEDTSKKYGFKVWVFCFMPDHLHLLLEGISPDSDLRKVISSYKQHTGYHYKMYAAAGLEQLEAKKHFNQDNVAQGLGENCVAQGFRQNCVVQGFSPAQKKTLRLWQPSYYDHILRKEEDTLNVVRYILENPVRKGLVKHFLEYEHTGSFELDLSRCV